MTELQPHGRIDLLGLDADAMTEALARFGVEKPRLRMRRNQLWQALYCQGLKSFDHITTIAKPVRIELDQQFTISRPEITGKNISKDGTIKWLLRFQQAKRDQSAPEAEMVYIPEKNRGTLCVSSQVGCTLNCRFCHTGTQKLVRNLTTAEIIGQVLLARDELGDWPGSTDAAREAHVNKPDRDRSITNIVFMGMGEPLYNFDEVVAAIKRLTDPGGLGFSKRRVTVSTAGVAPKIQPLGAETDAALAISLHATNDELRNELVPINRKYPLDVLLNACRTYPNLSNVRRITFEYVMLDGVNDSDEEAQALVRRLTGIPAKINLIPFNPWPGAPFQRSSERRIKAFADLLTNAGYSSPVRRPRGQDILAACGQLRSTSLKLSASKVLEPVQEK